jgi:hypothetical protein
MFYSLDDNQRVVRVIEMKESDGLVGMKKEFLFKKGYAWDKKSTTEQERLEIYCVCSVLEIHFKQRSRTDQTFCSRTWIPYLE